MNKTQIRINIQSSPKAGGESYIQQEKLRFHFFLKWTITALSLLAWALLAPSIEVGPELFRMTAGITLSVGLLIFGLVDLVPVFARQSTLILRALAQDLETVVKTPSVDAVMKRLSQERKVEVATWVGNEIRRGTNTSLRKLDRPLLVVFGLLSASSLAIYFGKLDNWHLVGVMVSTSFLGGLLLRNPRRRMGGVTGRRVLEKALQSPEGMGAILGPPGVHAARIGQLHQDKPGELAFLHAYCVEKNQSDGAELLGEVLEITTPVTNPKDSPHLMAAAGLLVNTFEGTCFLEDATSPSLPSAKTGEEYLFQFSLEARTIEL
jgi:hypothetical protein